MNSRTSSESNSPPEKYRKKKITRPYYPLDKALTKFRFLKPTDKILVAVLREHHNPIKGCFPGHSVLIKETGFSKKTLDRCKKRLKEAGLLRWRLDPSRNNVCVYEGVIFSNDDKHWERVLRKIQLRQNDAASKRRSGGGQKDAPVASKRRTNKLNNKLREQTTTGKSKKPVVASLSKTNNSKTKELAAKLQDLGCRPKEKATELINKHGAGRIQEGIRKIPRHARNPIGWLIRSLEEKWQEPAAGKRNTREGWEESEKYKKLYSRPSQKAFLEVIKKDLEKYGISEERLKEWREKLDPKQHPEFDKWVEENRDRLKKRRKRN